MIKIKFDYGYSVISYVLKNGEIGLHHFVLGKKCEVFSRIPELLEKGKKLEKWNSYNPLLGGLNS